MKAFWVHALFWSFFSTIAFAGEAVKTGIVKGAISAGGRPISDVVVSVEGLPQDFLQAQINLKPKPAVMDQQDMKFIPHVLPVLVGTRVEFTNNDKTFHSVFSPSEPKKFDLGLYSPGRRRSVTFDKLGVVRILCSVHPNMEAYIVVKNHPYFSIGDARGNYALSGVPLGKFRIEVWHPQLGTKIVPAELVRQGEVLAVDVDLKGK